MGEAAKLVILKVSKQVVMSFCVAGVALVDILACQQKRGMSLCMAGAILFQGFQKMSCSFRARHSTLAVSIVILPGSTLGSPIPSTFHCLQRTGTVTGENWQNVQDCS